jgi:hypothetical protein
MVTDIEEDAMPEELKLALERSRDMAMSGEDREAQRRSFVYGNTKIENDYVTREVVEAIANDLADHDP